MSLIKIANRIQILERHMAFLKKNYPAQALRDYVEAAGRGERRLLPVVLNEIKALHKPIPKAIQPPLKKLF